MKTFNLSSYKGNAIAARHASNRCVAAVLVVLLGISLVTVIGQTQPSDNDVPGAEVLTRGPVHEAFAGIVSFNPDPGIIAAKAPPAVIEELPPEERPQGDNITWIPGYWAWDDERSDYLWISGTWRALPPGRAWMTGYWGKTSHGYQWTSGYWADAAARVTVYLPPPPATVEVGPNIAAPSDDYGWSPGCWIWYQGRYAWRPGYWVLGRADWDWCPGHYVWTPRGYIFVGGFWDYPIERRGILFAPVYFESSVYLRRGYLYSPRIVIGLGVFNDHLFLRPRFGHYYFGDYYASSYYEGGFYASFSFQSSRHGYDPIYSHQRWEHRRDHEWEHRAEASYQNRRDNETARPPRTWAAQRNFNPGPSESRENRVLIATPIDQLTRSKDSPLRFQTVAKEERQRITQRGQEVQKSRDERRTVEASVVAPTVQKPSRAFEPVKVQLPRSPIVAKSANQLGRNESPPKVQQSPKPDPKFQPKSETPVRQPNVERSNPQPESRKPESERKSAPERIESPSREKQVQPEPQPRVKESGNKFRKQEQQNARDVEKPTRVESEQRAKDTAVKTAEDSQRNARALQNQAEQESKQRANDSAARSQEEARQNSSERENKSSRVSEQTARERPTAGEKGASRPLKRDHDKEDKGRP